MNLTKASNENLTFVVEDSGNPLVKVLAWRVDNGRWAFDIHTYGNALLGVGNVGETLLMLRTLRDNINRLVSEVENFNR